MSRTGWELHQAGRRAAWPAGLWLRVLSGQVYLRLESVITLGALPRGAEGGAIGRDACSACLWPCQHGQHKSDRVDLQGSAMRGLKLARLLGLRLWLRLGLRLRLRRLRLGVLGALRLPRLLRSEGLSGRLVRGPLVRGSLLLLHTYDSQQV